MSRLNRAERLALVVNMSGGKDSCDMLVDLKRRHPALPMFAVYADTGFEHIKPISAEDFSRQICLQLGVPFFVVKSSTKDYLSMVEKRGMFPSPSNRQCTSDLKRDPIHKWIRQQSKPGGLLAGKVIINCTGIRAEESAARAKQRPLKREKRLCVAGRVVWNWMPIFRRSLGQVLDNLEAAGVPLHPVYSYRGNGGYLRRLSCRVCIFATDQDLCNIYHRDREGFDLVSNLEIKIGFTMRPKESLLQVIARKGAAFVQELNEAEIDEVPCAA